MRIIDFHTHLFPDDLAPRAMNKLLPFTPKGASATDGTAAALIKSMHRYGIDRSVVLPVATRPEQVPSINSFQITLDPSVFIPFGALHPRTDTVDEVTGFLQSYRIAGVKMHPEYQDFQCDAREWFPLYEALAAAGLCLVLHAGKDPGPFTGTHARPSAIRRVIEEFPQLTVIAAHMGGWDTWEESYTELCGKALYFDTSAIYGRIGREHFMRMVRKHGSERILFGSDSPWVDQGRARRWIETLSLSDEEKTRIFHRNAEALLSPRAGSVDGGNPLSSTV